jgi:hypothetical protein
MRSLNSGSFVTYSRKEHYILVVHEMVWYVVYHVVHFLESLSGLPLTGDHL